MIDYHSELQALVDACESFADPISGHRIPWQTALDRARAVLAEPEPEGPTDEELVQTAIDTRLYRFQATAGDPIQYEMTEQQIHAFARAILSRWGNNNTSWSNFDG